MKFASVAVCVFLGAIASPLWASQVGLWQFDNNLDNAVVGGAAMSAVGGWAPSYVNETIGGSSATVLSFPALSNSQALDMPNEAGANGGSATTTNIWSIVMDVRFPSVNNFNALWETGAIGGSDADYFARDTEGIGTSGAYGGPYDPTVWNRIAVTIDPLVNPVTYTLKGYVDGVHVVTSTTSSPPDGKEAVGAFLHLFTDNDGEAAAGLVNSIAYYDEILSDAAIASLGAASAGGIGAVPEPTSLILAGLSVLVVSWKRRRPLN